MKNVICLAAAVCAIFFGNTVKAQTFTVKQITFNGVGEEPLPNPGDTLYTPAPIAEGLHIWSESGYEEMGVFWHENLYLDNEQESILLDRSFFLPMEYWESFTIVNDGERFFWSHECYSGVIGGYAGSRDINVYNNGNIISGVLSESFMGPYGLYPEYHIGPNYILGLIGGGMEFQAAIISLNTLESYKYDFDLHSLACVLFEPKFIQTYNNGFLFSSTLSYDAGGGEFTTCEEQFFLEVPEPASLLLLGLGGLLIRKR